MNHMNIKTSYAPAPVPLREFDWQAIDDNTYDGPGSVIGFGPTEALAVADLLMQLSWRE
jgi:hypothetical protein